MSLYAVKNDECGYAFCEIGKPHWETDFGTLWTELYKPYAQRTADDIGGQVVPLIEAPAKVVVSEAEAEMLEGAKKQHNPAWYIGINVDGRPGTEDRLMRAYVNGWEVEKPKRFALPMDGTELADGTVAYAALDHTGAWTVKGYAEEQSTITFGSTVTQADIDAAPDWVKAITPVEVTDDEQ